MRNKKVVIIVIALILIAGTGTFVFAGRDGTFEEQDINYQSSEPTYNRVDSEIKGQDVPVIDNNNEATDNENTGAENPNIEGNGTNTTTPSQTNPTGTGTKKPGTSGSQGSGITGGQTGSSQNGETTTGGNAGTSGSAGDAQEQQPSNPGENVGNEELKFAASLAYSYTGTLLTNQDITLTIITNKTIDKISDGWKKVATNKAEKTFKENANGEVVVINGNEEITLPYNIDKIDKIPIVATVSYSETKKTYHPVVITITSDKPINAVSEKDWKYGDDKKTITKIFESKINETSLILEDEAKNQTKVNYNVLNYDDSPITSTKTSDDGTSVVITYKEPIDGIDNWERLENGDYQAIVGITKNEDGEINLPNNIQIKYEAAPKVEEIDVKRYDSNGNLVTSKRKIANYAIVTIKFSKKIAPLDGWTQKDEYTITKTELTRKTDEPVEVYDLNGNSTIAKYSVSNVSGIATNINSVDKIIEGNKITIVLNMSKASSLSGNWINIQNLGLIFEKSYSKEEIEKTVSEDLVFTDNIGIVTKKLKIYYNENKEVVVEIDSKIMN